MASPQTENGYTRIANELLEAVTRTELTGPQMRVMLAIVRKTYGFNKTCDDIPVSQLAGLTGLHDRTVRRILGALEVAGMIEVKKTFHRPSCISVQKDFDRWMKLQSYGPGWIEPLTSVASPGTCATPGTSATPTPGTRATPPLAHVPDSKDTSQKTKKRQKRSPTDPPEALEEEEREALRAWGQRDGRTFSRNDCLAAEEAVLDWARSNGKRKADWVATIRNGMREGWALRIATGDGEQMTGRALSRVIEEALAQ